MREPNSNANMPTDFDVPNGLTELLQEFTVAVLRSQPTNLTLFARDYFERKFLSELADPSYRNAQTLDNGHISSDESDCEPPPEYFLKAPNRRKSVSAERYDPEASDEDEIADKKIIYPKTDEQRKKLGEAVKDILIFRALDAEQKSYIIDAMLEKQVGGGDVIIEQGDDVADFFYVIQTGCYDVLVDGKLVHSYDNVGSFGELALLHNTPRAATIKATSDGLLWALDRNTFKKIVLKSAYLKRKMYEEFIDSVPILKSLEAYERMNICDALVSKTFDDEEEIIKEGDESNCMYFLEDGEVRILRTGVNGENKEVNRLTKGQYFGELGLLSNKPRAASVYAVGFTKCAVLDVVAFERLLGPCKEIMRRNADSYEEDMIRVFGGKDQISDLREDNR